MAHLPHIRCLHIWRLDILPLPYLKANNMPRPCLTSSLIHNLTSNHTSSSPTNPLTSSKHTKIEECLPLNYPPVNNQCITNNQREGTTVDHHQEAGKRQQPRGFARA